MREDNLLYRISDLSLSIKESRVLAIDALAIEEGGVCCLVGPNGAGKSVALSLLAGLHGPDGGTILYRGRPLSDLHGSSGMGQEVTLLHQHPYLFRGSVLSNVVYGMARRGLSRAERERQGMDLLASVGLGGFARRRSGKLSAGEASRVALARALGCGAKTLLLDEPTAAIDRRGVELIESIIATEAGRGGHTVIMSTHSMDQARRIARRILYVRDGRIHESEPENIIAGRVVLGNGSAMFHSGRISFAVSGAVREGACSVGIGEGDISLVEAGEAAQGPNMFSGRIVSLSGDNGSVSVTVDAGERLRVRLEEGANGLEKLGIGAVVNVAIPPERVHIVKHRIGKGD